MTRHIKSRFLDRTTPPHIATLILLAGIGAMNMSVFLPSLPRMTTYFDTEYAVMQLSVSLYLAITAVVQLVVGPFADRYGRRPTVLISLAIFLCASVGCLLSTSAEMFLVFRMLQGAVAVGMVLSRAIVRDIVPTNQSASMIGYVTMGMALVPMISPAIGGTLDHWFNWQATFVFLIGCGLIVWIITFFDQGETNTATATSFVEQFREYPELLRARRFWGYVACAAFASGAFFAFLGGAPYVATEVFALTPQQAGMGFGIPAVGYATGNFITGRYSARFGINRMILAGTYVTCFGMAISLILSLLGLSHPLVFFGFCLSVGLGNGLLMPNATAGLLSVRPKLAGTASGLGSACLIGGGAALSVLSGVVLEGGTSEIPLQILMLVTSILSWFAIQYVMRRASHLQQATP
ncbi:multidrug effflux MFS transporter [Algirhabdus cladophorae]|uniref:multidrug effflux MFS transporter n=1 Tax=Algirhabdus cladophorae TaxID=3377108 RepID=UPI003B84528F